ncbi:MAG: bacillithiol biosynthesis deacetylase BshB1 [Bacteroidetes bacterium]|jgi:bacillithiol biosynthesis deacetylase BshB1|nr:bacillithiol biosynthesis deacetylase BshB1 [Bacteroidota bacterium]MDF2453816.1 bacillithiol biosynthesis deacetylase BshB1 [Bacteroidota bacterium]
MKLDILAIGVHPDDVELSASGTILKHIALGKTVGILDLTRGELGTRGSAAIRTQEAHRSAKILGVSVREQLNMADGFFENNEAHQKQIIQVIRKFQPEIVLCNAVSDRHPDHGRSARLIADACFLSGLMKIETKSEGRTQTAWRPKAVYHYIQDQFMEPDFVVDVTAYMDKKMESIMAFSSQFYNPNSREPETPISSKSFMENVKAKATLFGRAINCNYAEGFTVNRYIGVENLFDLR